MTVKGLIEILQRHEPDRIVVMSQDSEGNGFSPLSEVGTAAYAAESTWSGVVGMESLNDADRDAGFTEDDVVPNGKPALVLWPTN